jgi:hypothetical protein
MFRWFRRWHERAQRRLLERVLAENRAWKARWRSEHGDQPFPITPEERQSLREKRDRLRRELSPEDFREVWPDDDDRLFGLDDEPPGADSLSRR